MALPGTTELTVNAVERLTPGMVRVRFQSEDLSAFAGSDFTDRYVKIAFPDGEDTTVRTYTAIQPDVEAGTLAIDFVVHGDTGVAGPWAAAAAPGDRLTVRGPGGGYTPSTDVDWHLLAGDESALPAITAAVAALPADAVGDVLVEVPGPEHEIPFDAPAGVQVTWLHGGSTSHTAASDAIGEEAPLVTAVRALPWREGRVQVFVHGEAHSIMHGIRPYLLKEREVPRQDASISGYWRRGRTEEGFRAWKSELARSEG